MSMRDSPVGTPPPFEIKAAVSGQEHRLYIKGELDMATAPELEDAIANICDGAVTSIVLDLSEVAFMDSTGLRAVLGVQALCRRNAYGFMLGPLQRPVRRLFEITGVYGRMPFERPSATA